jgi:hypothetical protein
MKAPNKFIKFIEDEINADEIIDWIMEASDEDMEVSNIHIASKPTGDCQGEYEYCNQAEHENENGIYAYSGTYYHKFEDSNLWLAYEYYMDA